MIRVVASNASGLSQVPEAYFGAKVKNLRS